MSIMAIRTDGYDSKKFFEFIAAANSIVLTTHVNPDGDAIGSELGLAEYLRTIGKEVHVINHSPTPPNYLPFDQPDPILEQFNESQHDALIREADLFIILDVNDPARIRSLEPYTRVRTKPTIVVDHHLEPKTFATEYFVDTEACSTGEIVFKLIEAGKKILGGLISPKGAAALYTAIMTDTGSFRFPRTDSEVLRICADLLDAGADPVRCYDLVYNSSAPSRLLLLRESLNSFHYYYEDRMALQILTQEQLKKTGAAEEEVDGFVQTPFQIKGVVLSVFLLQLKEGWKISCRSKGDVSAAQLAQSFGGNGHFNAAGARVQASTPPDAMKEQIVYQAGKVLGAL